MQCEIYLKVGSRETVNGSQDPEADVKQNAILYQKEKAEHDAWPEKKKKKKRLKQTLY